LGAPQCRRVEAWRVGLLFASRHHRGTTNHCTISTFACAFLIGNQDNKEAARFNVSLPLASSDFASVRRRAPL
jgi:hypothetical protein